jgi:hypothetical protein
MHFDRDGQALVADGYEVVETEPDFVRRVFGTAPLHVRGDGLSRWAEEYCRARDLPFRHVRSPVADLMSVCDGLSAAHAAQILEELARLEARLPSPTSARTVLRALYMDGPWQEQPSERHAAQWLLWLEEPERPDYAQPLLAFQAGCWHDLAPESLRDLYGAITGQSATELLDRWLGLVEQSELSGLHEFPLDVPERWLQRARAVWTPEIIRSGAQVFERLRSRSLPSSLLEVAATETGRYLASHPAEINPSAVRALIEFLPDATIRDLQRRRRPTDPGDVPTSPDLIVKWYRDWYVPYREWEAEFGDADAHRRVLDLGRQFATWYLNFYPSAIAGGQGSQLLAISYATALRDVPKKEVLLWIVLDGLHTLDADLLADRIKRNERLTITKHVHVFATIPTVTPFCKPALLKAAPPILALSDDVPEVFPAATAFNDSKDAEDRVAGAIPGNIYIWRIAEPDKTYHQSAERSVLAANARARLTGLADRIIGAAIAVPESARLRVSITTDHGRLFGGGARRHAIPTGMQAHGRAAWGDPGITEASVERSSIDQDELVLLSGRRYGLPVDCAVVLNQDSFVMSDGKTGSEEFGHGGLFPEEVIIPWLEIVRDRVLPTVRCLLVGKGRSGARGQITVTVENQGDRQLVLAGLVLRHGDQFRTLSAEGSVAGMSVFDVSVELDQWPSQEGWRLASAELTVALPDGTTFTVEPILRMESEEMYRRDTTLEDLR